MAVMIMDIAIVGTVRRTSKLPAALDEYLVRAADGFHAVAEPLEEAAALARLCPAAARLLSRLHHLARLQGQTTRSASRVKRL